MSTERDGDSAREWLEASDAELLAECEIDTYRASGPGGQKRNKTSSAVRLRHQPTGLVVTAVESRSQRENRARAIRRLRQALALTQRRAVAGEPPAFYADQLARDPALRLTARHPDYWRVVQYVLDVLAARGMSVAEAAGKLGISTGQLIRFLKNDPKVWEQATRMRKEAGLSPLR